ncbi:GNAT family N-acetyltransferase [Siphonobacter sp. SORGH_AS_1065]|uniref:GNAT family N-acetyltransferase n=1 Tax=Siphonobacter sp. SORGH_AS_1065 TaxID=3041795 RepID=UPI0027893243|nr:GNAT family N-acetyltransferase [Siphonobacter sp. SORGH_AS_1065]MDQ1085820.1 ribosomal protein S18 acetylase RimI-like enzyme [Siphonobacter sp. SORGH_AS_1065]
MTAIVITPVTLDDLSKLQQIEKETFYETFAETNTAEDMQDYLAKSFSDEKVTSELTNPESAFYFALEENRVIGYLKINSGQAQTEIKDLNSLEIERIYVLQEFQGRKVGQLLYNKALSVARERNFEYLWLGVWEKNEKAIHFYKKNGFETFDQHVFVLGTDEQVDLMMRLKL